MTKVTRSIIINAPREKVYEVIADFEGYPKFLPETKEVSIEKASAKEVVATFTLQMIKEVSCTLRFKMTRPSGISWTLVEGEMITDNKGSWKLKKLSPRKTEVKYTIDVSFGLLVPGFISKMLMENNLPKMLDNFKKRIEGR